MTTTLTTLEQQWKAANQRERDLVHEKYLLELEVYAPLLGRQHTVSEAERERMKQRIEELKAERQALLPILCDLERQFADYYDPPKPKPKPKAKAKPKAMPRSNVRTRAQEALYQSWLNEGPQ